MFNTLINAIKGLFRKEPAISLPAKTTAHYPTPVRTFPSKFKRKECKHAKLSHIQKIWKGHEFGCRQCGKTIFVPDAGIRRPYSQNPAANAYYAGRQRIPPLWLNSYYIPKA